MSPIEEFFKTQTMESIPRKYRRLFPKIDRYVSITALGKFCLEQAVWFQTQAESPSSKENYNKAGGSLELQSIAGVYKQFAFVCLNNDKKVWEALGMNTTPNRIIYEPCEKSSLLKQSDVKG